MIRLARFEPPSLDGSLGEGPGGLDELGIVQEHQGLERSRGRLPLDGADFAGGRVESQHGLAAARFASRTNRGCGGGCPRPTSRW